MLLQTDVTFASSRQLSEGWDDNSVSEFEPEEELVPCKVCSVA